VEGTLSVRALNHTARRNIQNDNNYTNSKAEDLNAVHQPEIKPKNMENKTSDECDFDSQQFNEDCLSKKKQNDSICL
jgi:hypothetical protein